MKHKYARPSKILYCGYSDWDACAVGTICAKSGCWPEPAGSHHCSHYRRGLFPWTQAALREQRTFAKMPSKEGAEEAIVNIKVLLASPP